jgi:predicted metal-dependent phosphotriesterase family hydrolase
MADEKRDGQAMTGSIRTLLGDIAPTALGRTDYHEHLFQVSPLLPGDDLDDERRSSTEAGFLVASGFQAMVDATPIGLGRRPEAVARISAGRGLRVVATSGAHRDAHYAADHWLITLTEEQLAARFAADVETGMPEIDGPRPAPPARTPAGEAVRAGVLKAGIDYWRITPFERRVLAAVGAAHGQTGAPVMVHLEHGSAAFEVLAVLAAEGVAADAVALAHIDRNPDPQLHAELAAAGAYLGYDGFARSRQWPDSMVLDCLLRADELGATDRLLIGGDVARSSRYVAYGGMPGLAYLGERAVPRLELQGHGELITKVLIDNPARWLTFAAGQSA